jgi:hypothetical protein
MIPLQAKRVRHVIVSLTGENVCLEPVMDVLMKTIRI